MNDSQIYYNESNQKNVLQHKKKKHISPYFMISSSFPQIVYKMMHENPIALLVFFSLMDCSNNNGAVIITEKHLAKALQISITSVYKAIRYLNQGGYLKILDYGGHNLYVLNANIFWHTYTSVRKNIIQDMDFKSVAQLTRKSNHKARTKHTKLLKSKRNTEKTYQEMHKELLAYKNNNVENSLIIRKCIKNHRRDLLPSNFIKEVSKNQLEAKHKIRELINDKLSPTKKEHIVIEYVLRNTPAIPDRNMRMLVKKSKNPKKYTTHVTNKGLASLLPVSYKIIADTLYKLRKINVIDRKPGRIFFNPNLTVMEKAKVKHNKHKDIDKHKSSKADEIKKKDEETETADKLASHNPYLNNQGNTF